MKKIFLSFLILFIFSAKIFSQNFEISGKVIDLKTKESLPFVSIIYNSQNQGYTKVKK